MKKEVNVEALLESLSILRGYLLDNARLREDAGLKEMAKWAKAEANGIALAMETVRWEAKTDA